MGVTRDQNLDPSPPGAGDVESEAAAPRLSLQVLVCLKGACFSGLQNSFVSILLRDNLCLTYKYKRHCRFKIDTESWWSKFRVTVSVSLCASQKSVAHPQPFSVVSAAQIRVTSQQNFSRLMACGRHPGELSYHNVIVHDGPTICQFLLSKAKPWMCGCDVMKICRTHVHHTGNLLQIVSLFCATCGDHTIGPCKTQNHLLFSCLALSLFR